MKSTLQPRHQGLRAAKVLVYRALFWWDHRIWDNFDWNHCVTFSRTCDNKAEEAEAPTQGSGTTGMPTPYLSSLVALWPALGENSSVAHTHLRTQYNVDHINTDSKYTLPKWKHMLNLNWIKLLLPIGYHCMYWKGLIQF